MAVIAKFSFLALLTAVLATTIQAQPIDVLGGSGSGALGLEVFKNLGVTDDPGYRLIDAGALVSSRRAAFSSRARGAAGPEGPQGALVDAPPTPAPSDVDLCYLVDVTGSMSPHIKAVKDSIRSTVAFLTKSTGAVGNLRLCFVGYRDTGDDPNVQSLPLTSDVASFLSFVDNLRATGGKDEPEDIFSGLEEIGRQPWNARRRIVLHMADAPCHGDGCGSGTKDSKGRTAEDVFLPFRVKKLKYNFGRITPKTNTMMKLFSEALGVKVPLFDVSPALPPAPTGAPGPEGPSGGTGGGAPGPPTGAFREIVVTNGDLKKKVGEASIAAVLLGLDN